MEYSFPQYLLAKQSVDDRALNKDVLQALRLHLSPSPLRVIELGAGIGTMLTRLLRWDILPPTATYILLDQMPENIAHAHQWLPLWAGQNGWQAQPTPQGIHLQRGEQSVQVELIQADLFDYIPQKPQPAHLLIAHAVLDLLPMPQSLPPLLSLLQPGGLAWLTINFDGVTTLEPTLHPELDSRIESLYHLSMDKRPSGGDSQSGRHLFGHLKQAKAPILAAGASDWVVYPYNGEYPAQEAYFLHFILHFFEESLTRHPSLDPHAFAHWLQERHAQIDRAELVYIAHQMDFLVGAPT